METREFDRGTVNGWLMLFMLLASGVGIAICWMYTEYGNPRNGMRLPPNVLMIVLNCFLTLVWLVLWFGFFTLQPNVAAVMILFGKYTGTAKQSGFHWANPFLTKKKVSLRAHNLNGERIKVNDKRGNPVEIAAVVVWRVTNTAQAVFDVEDFVGFVNVQSESALRHLASAYPYDPMEDGELSLRGIMDEVSDALQKELQTRVSKAGVSIDEARLSHLAFAPEIAGAMLQRQQAEAVIAARTRIVDAAVGMVEMAITKLEKHETLKLDEERKAAMVSNLMVVLCGDKNVHPVINTGSLYT